MEILQNIKWVQKALEAMMAISLNLYKDGLFLRNIRADV